MLCQGWTIGYSLCLCARARAGDDRSQGGVCVEEARGGAAEAEGPCAATGF